jgi:hypothetical protein
MTRKKQKNGSSLSLIIIKSGSNNSRKIYKIRSSRRRKIKKKLSKDWKRSSKKATKKGKERRRRLKQNNSRVRQFSCRSLKANTKRRTSQCGQRQPRRSNTLPRCRLMN